MKKVISLLAVIVLAPLGLLFVVSNVFYKKGVNVLGDSSLFNTVYADVPPSDGAGCGGGSEGTSTGGVGSDAGGNAAAQGNSSSESGEGSGD